MNRKWNRTDKRSALVIGAMLIAAIVTGCAAATEEEKQATIERNNEKTRLIAIVDGCRIWAVYNESGEDPFFARCPEGAADTFEQHISNKQTKTTVTLGDQ
jgi:hypothetical protein